MIRFPAIGVSCAGRTSIDRECEGAVEQADLCRYAERSSGVLGRVIRRRTVAWMIVPRNDVALSSWIEVSTVTSVRGAGMFSVRRRIAIVVLRRFEAVKNWYL